MRSTMTALLIVALMFTTALGAITDDINPRHPRPPLQAAEANTIPGFGDGPTPMRPQPPRPRPEPGDRFAPAGPAGMYTSSQAVSFFADGATRWLYKGTRLVWNDCPGPVAENLATAPEALKTLIAGIAVDMRAELITALNPLRFTLWAEVNQANAARLRAGQSLVPIDLVNAVWRARVHAHADELAAGLPTVSGAGLHDKCDTGPCDCSPCPAGHTCDCQLYVEGADDCSILMRDHCNVDEGPDPVAGAATFDLGF